MTKRLHDRISAGRDGQKWPDWQAHDEQVDRVEEQTRQRTGSTTRPRRTRGSTPRATRSVLMVAAGVLRACGARRSVTADDHAANRKHHDVYHPPGRWLAGSPVSMTDAHGDRVRGGRQTQAQGEQGSGEGQGPPETGDGAAAPNREHPGADQGDHDHPGAGRERKHRTRVRGRRPGATPSSAISRWPCAAGHPLQKRRGRYAPEHLGFNPGRPEGRIQGAQGAR